MVPAATPRHPFPPGTHVEAVKPGGRHKWRPAQVVTRQGDQYHVCFRGELAHYAVAVRNVRARPLKAKAKEKPKVSELVEIVSDNEQPQPPEPGEILKAQPHPPPKATPFAPPGTEPLPEPAPQPAAPVDPYANIRVSKGFVAPFNPPAPHDDPYSAERMRAVLYNPNPPLPPQPAPAPQRPWYGAGWRERKKRYHRARGGATATATATAAPDWLSPAAAAAADAAPLERPVARDTVLQASVAREQRRLGVDKDLARFAIPRKPLPPWMRARERPRMSLGAAAAKQSAAAPPDAASTSPVTSQDTPPRATPSARRRLSTPSDDSDSDDQVMRRRRFTPRKRRRTDKAPSAPPAPPTPPREATPPPDTRGNGRRKQPPARHAGATRLAAARAVDAQLARRAAALSLDGAAQLCGACGKVHAPAPGGQWSCGLCQRAGCSLDHAPAGGGADERTVCASCTDALACGLARLTVSVPAGSSWAVPMAVSPLVVERHAEVRSPPRARAKSSMFARARRFRRRSPLTEEEVWQMQQNLDDLRAGVLPDSTRAMS